LTTKYPFDGAAVTDRFARVRDASLRDLVEQLDQAAVDLGNVKDVDEEVVDAVRQAATLLHELRMRG
jgi:hypothetical protein